MRTDIAKLIEGVVVAPDSAAWVLDLVTRLCVQHGIAVAPIASKLDSTPHF